MQPCQGVQKYLAKTAEPSVQTGQANIHLTPLLKVRFPLPRGKALTTRLPHEMHDERVSENEAIADPLVGEDSIPLDKESEQPETKQLPL